MVTFDEELEYIVAGWEADGTTLLHSLEISVSKGGHTGQVLL